MGLGQTTQMITQYAQANPNVRHIVIEHSKIWIEHFKKDHRIAPNTEIKQLECVEGSYKGDYPIKLRLFISFSTVL